ncbi:MAG: hypothetical protein MMC33_002679 [Icmadophila ericetorum]|nr:hypothetical protein [Icmadophila ericetorum]
MASKTPKTSLQQSQTSKPNSVSSSGILGLGEAMTVTVNLPKRAHSPDSRRRHHGGHSRSTSINGITEGIGNLNRWSQSTVSSKSSTTAQNRRNSFARRLSGSFNSLGGFSMSQSPPPNKGLLQKPRTSPSDSPQRTPSRSPLANPPGRILPIMTIPLLSQAVDLANTPATDNTMTPTTADLLTPVTHVEGELDYFGDKWSQKGKPEQNKDVVLSHKMSLSVSPSPPRRKPARNTQPHSHEQAANLEVLQAAQSHHHSKARLGGNGTSSGPSSTPNQRESRRRRKPPSQKAMLSKALQKANHAVLLDNAQNFEGAMDAYGEACDLLQQVMSRSSGEEDRKKLEAIRNTYKNRISELHGSDRYGLTVDSKALPKRPMSHDSKEQEPFSPITDEDEEELGTIEIATVTRVGHDYAQGVERGLPRTLSREQLPPRHQSLMPFSSNTDISSLPLMLDEADTQLVSWPHSNERGRLTQTTARLAAPVENAYLPPPLSPRRPLSPSSQEKAEPVTGKSIPATSESYRPHHARQETAESTSWLDTIDESGGSSNSSVHSRSSSIGLRRKRIRAPSGATEAEFDAALDAAVEAAYDDGLEPLSNDHVDMSENQVAQSAQGWYISEAHRNVDIAKQRLREAELEAAMALAKNHEMRALQDKTALRSRSDSIELDYVEDEAEEEERILEEMTRDYMLDDIGFDMQSKSALPRQSDSSGFSGRTWGSSIGSNPTTSGTVLSTVTESQIFSWTTSQIQAKGPLPPSHPPPTSALPAPPRSDPVARVASASQTNTSKPAGVATNSGPGVRERRLSGLKAKQLKIDTSARLPSSSTGPKTVPPSLEPPKVVGEPPKSASVIRESQQLLPSSTFKSSLSSSDIYSLSRMPNEPIAVSANSNKPILSPTTPVSAKITIFHDGDSIPPVPDSPIRQPEKNTPGFGTLRKTLSSTSLARRKSMVSTPVPSDDSPNTPLSRVFSGPSQPRNNSQSRIADQQTPTLAAFTTNVMSSGGIYYFDSDIHSPTSPGSPNSSLSNAPLPLEACPESFLLRPFWLLRSVYKTLAHPRGGYISNRLFVPRDIWNVKNVKLKSVEEKISNCDLLTAALLKLGKVDTLDADTVLEEMLSFENVLDQVQAVLVKKLGTDVGKGPLGGDDIGVGSEMISSRSSTVSSRSYLSSWRKLRSKNSTGPGIPLNVNNFFGKEGPRETLTMRSLPMTSSINPRFARRNAEQVQGIGPHAHYMAALARLCDAAQILDQIARQVEDPGLKHTSQTHVGLELSTRHAAEFFGFYVCRFVLNDIGMMLDKFIKRGSEWVLA